MSGRSTQAVAGPFTPFSVLFCPRMSKCLSRLNVKLRKGFFANDASRNILPIHKANATASDSDWAVNDCGARLCRCGIGATRPVRRSASASSPGCGQTVSGFPPRGGETKMALGVTHNLPPILTVWLDPFGLPRTQRNWSRQPEFLPVDHVASLEGADGNRAGEEGQHYRRPLSQRLHSFRSRLGRPIKLLRLQLLDSA